MADERVQEPRKPFLVGYARVSMSDQNCQRQIDELIKSGVVPRDNPPPGAWCEHREIALAVTEERIAGGR